MTYKKNFNIGSLSLYNNVLFAPLAEYTDFPFRRLLRLFHKGLIYCEMTKMEALVREKCSTILKYESDMHPIGAQICGTKKDLAYDSAKILEDLGFDIIDLNCGCPVSKIVKDGSGAAMLKDVNNIYAVLKNMVDAVKIPVTVKIRIGWDENSIIVKDVVKAAEEAGAKAITVHGRTKSQGYSGNSRWEYIKLAKETAKEIKVIGNGDIYTAIDTKNIFDFTNCDGIMISRGILKMPWISQEIESFFENTYGSRDWNFRKNLLLKYIEFILEDSNEQKAIFDIRRISGWILRELDGIKNLRIAINSSNSINDIIKDIRSF
ncbi:MAG: tRNA dihydrouridine synthase DusB [Chlamydiae bacterium RIFCSPLOWO2_01_FULL_28_7]|nr:MAG: tRNA dihydrouridine synthase DusB [Chlamydiae bacterium RIFCSPLOWO2_01_FULL_28_7]